jgi:hypothetical protein
MDAVNCYRLTGDQTMNLYRFECTVWVRGNTLEEAQKELHDEVQYHFGQDNNLVALDSNEGELAEDE